MINIFHKDHFDKPISISLLVNFLLFIISLIVNLKAATTKQKYGWLAEVNGANKRTKKAKVSIFILVLPYFFKNKKIILSYI